MNSAQGSGEGRLLTYNKPRRRMGRRSPPPSHPPPFMPFLLSLGSALTCLLTCVPSRPSVSSPLLPPSILDQTHPGGPNPASKLDSEHPNMLLGRLHSSPRGKSRKLSSGKTPKVGWGSHMDPQGKRGLSEEKAGAGREGGQRPWLWLRRARG